MDLQSRDVSRLHHPLGGEYSLVRHGEAVWRRWDSGLHKHLLIFRRRYGKYLLVFVTAVRCGDDTLNLNFC